MRGSSPAGACASDGVNGTVAADRLDGIGSDATANSSAKRIEFQCRILCLVLLQSRAFPKLPAILQIEGQQLAEQVKPLAGGTSVRKSSILGRGPAFQAASNWSQTRSTCWACRKRAKVISSWGCGSIPMRSDYFTMYRLAGNRCHPPHYIRISHDSAYATHLRA